MKPVGRRKEVTVVVVAVLCVSAALIYIVYAQGGPATYSIATLPAGSTLFEAPGTPCNGTLPAEVGQLENTSQFGQETGGSCFNYLGAGTVQQNGQNFTDYTFDYYNGTIIYPCGTSPSELVVSQLQVSVPGNGSEVSDSSYQLLNDSSSLNIYEGCGPNTPPVGVVSADLVIASVPAIRDVNLTLAAIGASQPITSLTAIIEAQGANQTVAFASVTPSSPLQPGQAANVLELMDVQATLTPGVIYQTWLQGDFADGSSFQYSVQIVPVNA